MMQPLMRDGSRIERSNIAATHKSIQFDFIDFIATIFTSPILGTRYPLMLHFLQLGGIFLHLWQQTATSIDPPFTEVYSGRWLTTMFIKYPSAFLFYPIINL